MPLMGREISVRQAVQGTPPASMPPPIPPNPPVPVPLAAERKAQEAIGWANQANDIVQVVNKVNAQYGFPTALSTLAKTRGSSKVTQSSPVAQELTRIEAEAEQAAQRSLFFGARAHGAQIDAA